MQSQMMNSNRKRSHWIVKISLIFMALMMPFAMQAQRDKSQNPKKQMKEQQEAKQARVDKFNSEMKAREEHHVAIQDKKTRKRMKKTRKKSERMARRGTSEPFFRRVFRKRHFR